MVLPHRRGLAVAACAAAVAALAAALGTATGADARRQATTIDVLATMNSASEVPAPTGNVSGARGAFSATFTGSGAGATLDWQLSFSGLTGPATAAHIHVAGRGQSGPVAVPLCGPCTSPASGSASVDAAVLTALVSGGAYVNVHTDTNKAGEIRGQLGVIASLRTALNARQEVPRPKGALGRAAGTFVGTVTKEGTTGSVTWRLTFSRLTGRAVAAHIHIGRRGRSGPVAVVLCGPCRSGARGSASVPASALAAIEAGRAYVNVHTARNPAGEIRGQLPVAAFRVTS
jgi:CHRD domain